MHTISIDLHTLLILRLQKLLNVLSELFLPLVSVDTLQVAKGTFPENQVDPARSNEHLIVRPITKNIASDLSFPKISIRRRPFEVFTVVSVPEATIHENGFLATKKDYIRFPWQIPVMQAISIPAAPQPLSHDELRFCVPGPDF